jgi:methyl-accepting chemotaxis protein
MDLFRYFRNLNVGIKLNVVVVLALGVLLATIVVVVDRSIGDLIAETGRHRVEQEAELIQSRFTEADMALSADAKILANTPGLVDALVNGDATAARTALAIGAASVSLQGAAVVDATGAHFATSVGMGEQRDATQENTLISLALLGIEISSITIEANEQGELESQLAAALPLRNVAGEIVGGLIARRRVDDEFLEKINYSRKDVHILLIYDGQILAQSARPSMEEEHVQDLREPAEGMITGFEGIVLDETAIEQAKRGKTVTASDLEYTTDGVPHAIAYAPLAVGGNTRAVISILYRSDQLFAFQSQLTTWLIIIVAALSVSAMFAVVLFVWRAIAVPIRQLTSVAQVVTQGNLEIKAQVRSDDEIGVLAGAFNQMIFRLREMLRGEQEQRERLRQAKVEVEKRAAAEQQQREYLQHILTQVSRAADSLNSAAAEILAATSQQVSGASEQSASVTQTTTTVDEVRAIAEQSVVRAQEVTDASQLTVEVSRAGQQAVQDTIRSIGQIKAQVEGIAENILALAEQTLQIGQIIATVNDIAAQSNILALNASVEAARAGEHGKGFAVVAVEVRNLAEQSKQATAQVREILSDIQKATNSTAMATEEGAKKVEEGVQLAAQAGEAIAQLTRAIEESAQAAIQMAAGGRQQAAGVRQIAQAMQNINQASIQSLGSTRQTETAAQELNDLARTLTEIVQQHEAEDQKEQSDLFSNLAPSVPLADEPQIVGEETPSSDSVLVRVS